MNTIWITSVVNQLRQIASTSNVNLIPFGAVEVAKIRENLLTIAKDIEQKEPQLSQQILHAKDILFYQNQFGQSFINLVALGEAIFGLDLLIKNEKKKTNEGLTVDLWSYIHPLIQKSSKKLFQDGHYANAAEDAFIEINDRVKKLFALIKPGDKIPDGDTAMTTVFSTNSPLVEFCDRSTETGFNKQKGYMQMLAGAMSALRNPKAHSNTEILSAEESYRRLATASMLMYAIDDAVKHSKIKE